MTSHNEGQLINLILSFWQSRHGIITMELNGKITVVWQPHEERLHKSSFGVQFKFCDLFSLTETAHIGWGDWHLLTNSIIPPLTSITTNCYSAHRSMFNWYPQGEICSGMDLPKANRFFPGWWRLSMTKCQYHQFKSSGCCCSENHQRWVTETAGRVITFEA